MPSVSQKITVDRLAAALAAQGVTLKRHQLIEVAARSFGHADTQHLTAAAKRGEIDPPVAEDLGIMYARGTDASTPIRILRDPAAGRVFAVEDAAFDPAIRADRFAVTPYGGLVALPSFDAPAAADSAFGAFTPPMWGDAAFRPVFDKAPPRFYRPVPPYGQGRSEEYEPSPEDRRRLKALLALVAEPDRPSEGMIGYVAAEDALTPDLERFGHLLSDQSFDVDAGPILYLTPERIVRIADRSFVSFEFDEEYDDHEQGMLLVRDLENFRREHGPRIERAGCRLEWNDDLDAGRVDVSVLVPTELASRIGPGREHDFWDAVAALLGSKRVETVKATFHPEAWKNDWAIEVDPQGETTFDVTFEVLVMGREAARLVEDNRDGSDELRDAVHAPDWIRKWAGPFRVEVADEIAEYLDQREEDEDEADDCGQCEGTGTIEGGLSGDGEDEKCPVCDGTGTIKA